MKVRVMVEVVEGGRTVKRVMRQTGVSPRAMKLYEMMGTEDTVSFLAEDVISGALKAVQDAASGKGTEAILNSQPAVDGQGRPKGGGMTKLDEALGLDIMDHMLKKDGAGAPPPVQRVPAPPPLSMK